MTAKQMKVTPALLRRFFSKVNLAGENECWLWTGKLKDGYGYLCVANKQIRAHRFMYDFFNQEKPSPEVVRHKCDVRNCVNPSHLIGGTHIDNVMDRVLRGRSAVGDKNKGGVKKGCVRKASSQPPEMARKRRPLNPKRRQRLIDMGLLEC